MRVGVVQRALQLVVQRDIALLHLVVEKEEHVNERDGVGGQAADDLAVILMVCGIGAIEELGDLIIEIGQLGELTGREPVGEHIAAHGFDVGKPQRGVDLVVLAELV